MDERAALTGCAVRFRRVRARLFPCQWWACQANSPMPGCDLAQLYDEMRHAMGVAVFSGMLCVTAFGLFLTPVFYVLLRAVEKRITRTEKVHHHV